MTKLKEVTCDQCEGEGVVWVLDWLSYDGSHDEHEEVCDKCDGEGVVLVDDEEEDEEYEEEDPDLRWEDHEERPL